MLCKFKEKHRLFLLVVITEEPVEDECVLNEAQSSSLYSRSVRVRRWSQHSGTQKKNGYAWNDSPPMNEGES